MAERKANGTFQKGVSGNPAGRPSKAREDKYHEIMITRVSFADWERIIDKAVDLAKRGDPAARKWLADYLIGPPVERKEISGEGGGPVVLEVVYVRGSTHSDDAD